MCREWYHLFGELAYKFIEKLNWIWRNMLPCLSDWEATGVKDWSLCELHTMEEFGQRVGRCWWLMDIRIPELSNEISMPSLQLTVCILMYNFRSSYILLTFLPSLQPIHPRVVNHVCKFDQVSLHSVGHWKFDESQCGILFLNYS